MADQNQIIKKNDQQEDPIKLDLVNNALSINPTLLNDILKQSTTITQQAQKLLKVDINNINEDEMTELNRKIKPISSYARKFKNFESELKRELKARDNKIVDQYHQLLKNSNFDNVESIVRQLNVKKKDFKANRGNKRWAEMKTYFDAQMETYPEIPKYASTTLGNFDYYRTHHDKLISDAKSKPVTNKIIKQLNDELYNYHQDLQHLLNSTLSQAYYDTIIEQYAAEPSTNKMLELIKQMMAQQVKDQNNKIIDKIKLETKQLLNKLWYQNKNINQLLEKYKDSNQDQNDFVVNKLQIMKIEGDAIFNSLQFEKFINKNNPQVIDTVVLESTLKSLIKESFERVSNKLANTKNKTAQDAAKEEINQKQKENKTSKNGWLLDYLQVKNWQHIHNNDKQKVIVINDLMLNLNNKNSIWRDHINSYQDIIETIKYITNL